MIVTVEVTGPRVQSLSVTGAKRDCSVGPGVGIMLTSVHPDIGIGVALGVGVSAGVEVFTDKGVPPLFGLPQAANIRVSQMKGIRIRLEVISKIGIIILQG
jgi:hypothetical protein